MTTTQSTNTRGIRRLASGAVLAAAAAVIALGAANVSHADTTVNNPGPSMSAPDLHPAFPHQSNTPRPGTSTHHHHQNRH